MAIFVEVTKNECIIQWHLHNMHSVCLHYENRAVEDGLFVLSQQMAPLCQESRHITHTINVLVSLSVIKL